MPAAVVFDLDGLLFNTEEVYRDVGEALLQRRGKCFSQELVDAVMGRPARIVFQTMIEWHGLPDTVETLDRESEEIFRELVVGRLAPTHGCIDLLTTLEEAGIRKAIATSSARRFVETVLAPFDCQRRFDFILTAEDVTHGKPHPEIYLTAARRFEIDPHEMVVLEDSQTGCRAAVSAGAFVVAVPGPHSRAHDFSGAHLVVDHLGDPRLYEVLGLPPTPCRS